MTVDTKYDKMTAEALKKECTKRGISDAGDKDVLITRLLQFDTKVSYRLHTSIELCIEFARHSFVHFIYHVHYCAYFVLIVSVG